MSMSELEILEFAEKMSRFFAEKQARKQELEIRRLCAIQQLNDISAALNTIADALNNLDMGEPKDEALDAVKQTRRELQRA